MVYLHKQFESLSSASCQIASKRDSNRICTPFVACTRNWFSACHNFHFQRFFSSTLRRLNLHSSGMIFLSPNTKEIFELLQRTSDEIKTFEMFTRCRSDVNCSTSSESLALRLCSFLVFAFYGDRFAPISFTARHFFLLVVFLSAECFTEKHATQLHNWMLNLDLWRFCLDWLVTRYDKEFWSIQLSNIWSGIEGFCWCSIKQSLVASHRRLQKVAQIKSPQIIKLKFFFIKHSKAMWKARLCKFNQTLVQFITCWFDVHKCWIKKSDALIHAR